MSTTAHQDNLFGSAMLDPTVAWISENLEPQEVFADDQLAAWAEANDWIKKEQE